MKKRTLVYDIECAILPEVSDFCDKFGVQTRNLSWQMSAGHRFVTHISYGWLEGGKVTDLWLGQFGKPELRHEKKLLTAFAEIYNTVDETIAHYGQKFDIRFLNTRMAYHGMPDLKTVKTIDTWRTLKDHFLMTRNTLDEALNFFKAPYKKPKVDQSVWVAAGKGDLKANKIMKNRCHYDVLGLRWLAQGPLRMKLGGAILQQKPNQYLLYPINEGIVTETVAGLLCTSCGVNNALVRRGLYRTKAGTQFQMRCKACGHWPRATMKLHKDGDKKSYVIGRMVR